MTCIKTGAVVHMIAHDICFAADIFAVEGARVVHANGPIVRGGNAWDFKDCGQRRRPTHRMVSGVGNEFWRERLGVFVIPANRLVEITNGNVEAA